MKTWIKLERARINITQAQLAEALGISVHAINSIEKRRYMPSIILAKQMAKYFKVSIDYLFYIDEEIKEKIDMEPHDSKLSYH